MPEGVVLDVEEGSLDGPAELPAEVAGVAVAPVRPRPGPGLACLRRAVERKAGGEEGAVIVGELEVVVALDAGEFGIGQAWPDFVPACPGEATAEQNGGSRALPARTWSD